MVYSQACAAEDAQTLSYDRVLYNTIPFEALPSPLTFKGMATSVFEAGTWVLAPHPDEEYVAGKVADTFRPGEQGQITLEDGTDYKIPANLSKDVSMTDTKSLESYENMIKLNNLNEPLILHNLRKRFYKDQVYTSISSILVAINPFKLLPLYTAEMLDQYKDGGWRNQPPHIYSVADNAYHSMLADNCDQAVVISGESGAGKTETMKLVLQFLAEVSGRTTGKAKEESLEQQILKSNPIMEAFGNAKTTRNNNSSRFGKWTEIIFNSTGSIVGGSIINYLLEKSRIPFQAQDERNYHVFYQVLAGAELDPEFRKNHMFGEPEDYHYLNQSGVTTVDTINDEKEWEELLTAMDVLNMDEDERGAIFELIAAILHLGNVEFQADPNASEDDASMVKTKDVLQRAAEKLHVESDSLSECMCYTKLKVAGSVTLKQYKVKDSANARDATSKALYGKLFDWLIERINDVLGGAKVKKEAKKETIRMIGVLDIFGFESFETNSFEQLCINYCNEKLQFHFNEHIFRLEQQEYESEGIDVSAIQFSDNKPTLDLLENKKTGIFAMIDEEINVPKGSDQGFLSKVLKQHQGHSNFGKPKPKDLDADKVFIVYHYAGKVNYNVTNFLEKNKDALHEDITNVVANSSSKFIAGLMTRAAEDPSGKGKKKQPTLGTQFKKSLNMLMDTLNSCAPHFVRCMKPNHKKKGDIFESPMMMAQLRYAGLLEVCRIRQIGYPVRKGFGDFLFRYRCLASRPVKDHKDLLDDLTKQGLAQHLEWQIGHSKVFMRQQQLADFEEAREKALKEVVTKIQKIGRRFIVRCEAVKWKEILNTLKKAIEQRTEEALDNALTDVPELPLGGEHMKVVKEARTLRERLEEEARVKKLLVDAISARDLADIQAAVAEAQSIEFEPEELKQAQDLVAVIQKEHECLQALDNAIASRDRDELANRLSEGEELGEHVINSDTYKQATTLKKRLDEEAAAVDSLRAAIDKREYDDLANALDKMEQMGMTHDLMKEGQELKEKLEAEAQAKKSLNEAIESRKLEAVKSAVHHATKLGMSKDLPELKQGMELQERLENEIAINEKLLKLADSENISDIENALAEANNMKPPLSETAPELEGVSKAQKRVETLKAWEECKKELSEASHQEKYDVLSSALSKAGDLNLPECKELEEARKAMDKLGAVAKVLNGVMDAVRNGDIAEIENAIAEAEQKELGNEQAVVDAKKSLEKFKEADKISEELKTLLEEPEKEKLQDALQRGDEVGLSHRYPEQYEKATNVLAELSEVDRLIESIDGAFKNRDDETLQEILNNAKEKNLKRVIEYAEKSIEAMNNEKDINAKIEKALEDKDTAVLKEQVELADSFGIQNSTVKKARIHVEREQNMDSVKQELKTAVDQKDMDALNNLLNQAIDMGMEGEEVDAAKKLRERMGRDKELAQDLRAAMKTLSNKAGGKHGIEEGDITPLDTAMEEAKEKGLEDDSPFMIEAQELRQKMMNILESQQAMESALEAGKLRELKRALDKAEDYGLDNHLVRKVKSRIREMERERSQKAVEDDLEEDAPALDDDEMRRQREEKMEKAKQNKYHFTKFPKIRSPDDFAKGVMLHKRKVKAMQLRWQLQVIPRSILDFPGKEESKIATRIHKNLLGYCGDKTMSFPATLAQDILQKGLEMPELVDEIYMQICKQLTHNPRPESQIRAWQVMCMAVGTFPPSRDFENYLLNFILYYKDGAGAIGNYARYSLRRLEGILNSGPSGFVPSVEEISAYKERPPILATIELVDGTPLTEDLPITPDLNVGKVLDICTHFMELQDPRMQFFGIFVEDIDDDKDHGLDALTDEQATVKKLPKTPRPLQNENYMGDVVTVKVRQNQPFKFVFKRKIFLKNQDEPSDDPMFCRLVYLQAVDEVIKGNIPIDTEEEVATMVAQFMAIELAEDMPDNVDDLIDEENGQLEEFIPEPWREEKKLSEWAEEVLKSREDALDIDPEQLQNDIVEQVKDHPLYGTCFFYVMKHKFPEHMSDFPEKLILAFNSEGLHFLDMNKETLSSFGYADVYRWGGSSTQFSLIIWNPVTQDTDEVSLFTSQAADMAALILDYINAIMSTTE